MNIVQTIENDVHNLNPIALVNEAKADITALVARVESLELILAQFSPAVQAVLALLPTGSAIPAEVNSLLAMLPAAKAVTPVQNNAAVPTSNTTAQTQATTTTATTTTVTK
jgi:hypothetical protein